jgi:hypothetical protein
MNLFINLSNFHRIVVMQLYISCFGALVFVDTIFHSDYKQIQVHLCIYINLFQPYLIKLNPKTNFTFFELCHLMEINIWNSMNSFVSKPPNSIYVLNIKHHNKYICSHLVNNNETHFSFTILFLKYGWFFYKISTCLIFMVIYSCWYYHHLCLQF